MSREKDIQICRQNLDGTDRELYYATEKRTAHLYELTRSVLAFDAEIPLSDAPAVFDEIISNIKETPSPSGNSFRERFFCDIKDVTDAAAVASYIFDTHFSSVTLKDLTNQSDKVTEKAGRISYFKGPAADLAFDVFASSVPDPSLQYARDFSAAAEDVYYGRAEFCILPVSNSFDGRLAGFYTTAEKYELVGVDECSVPYAGGETRFVLFGGKTPGYSDGERVKAELKTARSPALPLILCAASYYGLSCGGVDSLPTEFGTSDTAALTGSVKALKKLLFLLHCMQINYDLAGVYKNEDM